MDEWKLRISQERAEIFLWLFNLLKENPDSFLNQSFIEPATRRDFLHLMEWFEKAYDLRKAREAVEDKWGRKEYVE